MNDGLVLLAAWGQWLVLVGLLAFAIARHVADAHDDTEVHYERDAVDDHRDR